jgi:hypothetical protein
MIVILSAAKNPRILLVPRNSTPLLKLLLIFMNLRSANGFPVHLAVVYQAKGEYSRSKLQR